MSTYVYTCLPMSTHVYLCLPVSTCVYRCLHVSIYGCLCLPVYLCLYYYYYFSDKQHTECRGCSAKQKAYWSLYIVKNVNYEFHMLLVKNDTANN